MEDQGYQEDLTELPPSFDVMFEMAITSDNEDEESDTSSEEIEGGEGIYERGSYDATAQKSDSHSYSDEGDGDDEEDDEVLHELQKVEEQAYESDNEDDDAHKHSQDE